MRIQTLGHRPSTRVGITELTESMGTSRVQYMVAINILIARISQCQSRRLVRPGTFHNAGSLPGIPDRY